MAINLRANGVYLIGETVRIPARRSTGSLVWGDVLERNGAIVSVEVRQSVGRGDRVTIGRAPRTWTEHYTTTELDETARRFTSHLRRAKA